jgi:hypothetical protein
VALGVEAEEDAGNGERERLGIAYQRTRRL